MKFSNFKYSKQCNFCLEQISKNMHNEQNIFPQHIIMIEIVPLIFPMLLNYVENDKNKKYPVRMIDK